MTAPDLIALVRPAGGWYVLLAVKGKKSRKQFSFSTREQFDAKAATLLSNGWDLFFGLARFATEEGGRVHENADALKAFWVDIDCGPKKSAINPKTNRPDGYETQAEGLTALRDFCKKVGMPKPILVSSGNGIHAYWPLTDEVPRDTWDPVAKWLRKLCIDNDFYVDPSVFEASRVLRIPGTCNFKDKDNPKPVTVLSWANLISFDAVKSTLAVPETVAMPKPRRALSALGMAIAQNIESSFKKIMTRSANGNGCQQLLDCYVNRATLSEPRWFAALSIAKFCSDRDTAIHKLSAGHPDYDPAAVERKVAGIKGPHSCAEFEANNPGGCDGCPHKDKFKSPISLGKVLATSNTEEGIKKPELSETKKPELSTSPTIPEYPSPFIRGKNGGIYYFPQDAEEPIFVYEHDLYVLKRMTDPHQGDVVVMKLHLPRDGEKEFVVTNEQITDRSELRKLLARHGALFADKAFTYFSLYISIAIRELQYKRRSELMRTQFGWADKDSKFIIGDREISKDGIYHSPPSSVTRDIAPHLTPCGDYEEWKKIFNLYGGPGLEPHAFAALTAFGAPLLKFLGQKGAIINVIHPLSGTGKTTILHMCNSVYGHPEKLCASWEDTLNAKIQRLGIMNNLPFTADEMTNTKAQDFSTLAYSMSQGRGKDRMEASSNKLRINNTTWATISLCSSNASFQEKLATLKNTPDGELMRLIEYNIEYSATIPTDVAKEMFDLRLKENYGHAGDIYIQWLVQNLEEGVQTARRIQVKLDKELKLTQRERFWSAVLASNIAGGLIAKQLGIIDWDMRAIYQWACKMLLKMRGEVAPPVTDAAAVIGDFINRHQQNILAVNDAVDRRTNKPAFPLLTPRGDLVIRYEPDTKKMFIVAKVFKKDCVEYQISYKDTLQKLSEKGIYTGTTNKRMSKGMNIVSPGVHAIMLDCTGDEFIDMDAVVAAENKANGVEEQDSAGKNDEDRGG